MYKGKTMKKKDYFEGIIEKVDFPNKGIALTEEGERVHVSNVIEGQKIKGVVTKKRKGKMSGIVLELLEKSPDEIAPLCEVFGKCGGCLYQTLPYDKQLALKEKQVLEMMNSLNIEFNYEGILESPKLTAYRNKMEYSFGDSFKDGPLALGLHRRASTYDIVDTTTCILVDEDFNKILKATLELFQAEGLDYFSKKTHLGFLRHLIIRKGEKTNELLINLVTTSQKSYSLTKWIDMLNSLTLTNSIVGVLHTINDDIADAVKVTELHLLFGRDYFYEKLFDMSFKISPFSFFQTNTLGAEVLYSKVRDYVGETKDKIVFDLYSGTGTITQMLAPIAKKAVGVEIVEEAVKAAKENAHLNGLNNCEFIAGDVLKVIDELKDKPDIIVLDPPRDGIHPKALKKIIDFGVDQLVYVSCKPTSLVRDLEVLLQNGYRVERLSCVDMYVYTPHVECCVLLKKK